MSQRLILVRHGVTAWNREGRFQGQLDPPLDDEGEAQARLVADRVAAQDARPVRIVSSPLARAARTAEILAAALGAPVTLDPRLMEIGQGEWEGRTHAELAVEDAERYAAWRSRQEEGEPPGGEPIEAAADRVRAVLMAVTEAGEWPACLVSHGGTLRLAARELLGLGLGNAWALDLDNASVSVIARDQAGAAWRIERWNDAAHLLGRASLHVDEAEGQPLAL